MRAFAKNIQMATSAAVLLMSSALASADVDRIKEWRSVVNHQNLDRAYVVMSSKWYKQDGNEGRPRSEMEADLGIKRRDANPALESALQVARANPTDDLGYLALDFLLRGSRSAEQVAQFWPPMIEILNKHYVSDERIKVSLLAIARSSMRADNAASAELMKFVESVVANNLAGSDLRVRAAYYFAMSSERPINNLKIDEQWRLETRKKAISYAQLAADEGQNVAGFGAPVSEDVKPLLNSLENLSIGSRLPDVTAKIVEGDEDRLSNHRGKVVLMDFWATWCVPCVANLPKVAKLKKEMAGTPFEVIAVSSDDEENEVIEFIEDRMEMPFVNWHIGADSEMQKTFNIQGIPYYFLLDDKGVIQARGDFTGMAERAKELVKQMDES